MQNGFDIHILTIKESLIKNIDTSLSGAGNIHRTEMLPSFPRPRMSLRDRAFGRLWTDLFCMLDPYSGWVVPAVMKGAQIIRNNDIRVLIVSGPPFSPFVAAAMLKRITGVKLILDYRDPWTTHDHLLFGPKYRNPVFRLMNTIAEKLVIRKASAVVTCSNTMRTLFLNKFPWAADLHIDTIYNGYWSDPTVDIEPLYLDTGKTVMIYAGELYGERRIELIARPLKRLIEKGLVASNGFVFYVFGRIHDGDRKVVNKLCLDNVIVQRERVNYLLMLRYLKGSDILFLPSGAKVEYAIPFKFYDYLSVRRPIFALTSQDSELGRLMATVDCGEIADIGDMHAIESTLENMIRQENPYTFKGADRYTWLFTAQKYVDLIDRVLSC